MSLMMLIVLGPMPALGVWLWRSSRPPTSRSKGHLPTSCQDGWREGGV